MKKQWTAIVCVLAMSLHMGSATADEYTEAYDCALESFNEGYGAGPVAYCVGNAYDPSELQMKAYADAERDFKFGAIAQTDQCTFEFGIWIATGSRADGWEEGAQLIETLDDVAFWLGKNREVFLYDINGNKISGAVASKWFVRQGEDVVLTDEIRRACRGK